MRLYNRIYYSLYRMILNLGEAYEMKADIPRTKVALILSLFTGINLTALIGLLSVAMGKFIIINSVISTIVVGAFIITLNFLLIFYKDRYKEVEDDLSTSWSNEKNKNILITVVYVIFTIIFLWLSIRCIKDHPI